MTKKPNNLYLFTGKGGVGKTTLALAFANYLKKSGHDVVYASISSTNIQSGQSSAPQKEICQKLQIQYLDLVLANCAEAYIAKKLGSKVVAAMVVKTPFFKALVNMIPGFGYLIFLGKMLEEIHSSDYKKIIIFDSPASGHALTLLESTQNFHEIFRSGVIFDDTKRMLELIHSNNFMQINIVSILTEMSLTEGLELKETVEKLNFENIKMVINNALSAIPDIDKESNLPAFIQTKIKQENELLTANKDKVNSLVPHIPKSDTFEMINALCPYMEKLV